MLLVITVVDVIEDHGTVRLPGTQSSVVEIKRTVITDQAQHVGIDEREVTTVLDILDEKTLGKPDGCSPPVDDLVDLPEQVVTLLASDVLVDSAGDSLGAMHALAGCDADHLLAILAQQYTLPGDIGMIGQHTDNVAMTDLVVITKQQVRRREMEEVERMGL